MVQNYIADVREIRQREATAKKMAQKYTSCFRSDFGYADVSPMRRQTAARAVQKQSAMCCFAPGPLAVLWRVL